MIIQVNDISSCWHWIMLSGNSVSSNIRITVLNIYVPRQPSKKLEIWNQLQDLLISKQDSCVCLIGDFNCLRNEWERMACRYRALDSVSFNSFILNSVLLDVKAGNSQFTWCGSGNKMSRLDRALININ